MDKNDFIERMTESLDYAAEQALKHHEKIKAGGYKSDRALLLAASKNCMAVGSLRNVWRLMHYLLEQETPAITPGRNGTRH